jgi:23S rRNA pseudouridine1911/1915/1917 synthase
MIQLLVQEHQNDKRLDQVLAELLQDYSRSKLQQWLADGLISLNGETHCKGKIKVKTGSIITIDQVMFDRQFAIERELNTNKPEVIDLNIVHQDKDVIIINKQDNLVVHPGAGNRNGTLVNGLLYHFPELANLPRAGIVHRLDKDTSGLLVVARNFAAHNSLIKQLQERTVTRKYIALVNGHLISGGKVEHAIGRHPTNRTKMTVLDEDHPRARSALTYYSIVKKYPKHTLLELQLETGRTHQIRVHMAHIGYPIVGDAVYGRSYAAPKACNPQQLEVWQAFKRQALTAVELGFIHPGTKEEISWRVEIPTDMQNLITILEDIRE